ncbi:dihydroorotate dehydrogenase electron transfer subunit [Marinifilum caeruleilacunae]|uniref:Dihydroorotate dehydrogenase B (NAD(+)), electron transfer subunit n=1 Tax=Marinifilum caeruleilacunae TaxID=2499076 RepID=A0ABX1WQH7_9BACT|nr:dihydroorotate dehydrogenase electron transfer subunit [Marinifilum caeruleilacunae]NOU58237.1 dihydroorotate dehydrogenase electron transfer subunit [Marinifilum caeruleilacunae]
MKKLVQDFEVLQRKELNDDHFVLDVKALEPLPEIRPGQFVNVLVKDSNTTFLRRPLSIHFVDYERNTISLYIKKIGDGTKKLGELKEGDTLNIVYPLGNQYSIPNNANTLLVGGGCGVAPLLYLAKHLNQAGNKVTTLLGVRSEKDAVELDAYKEYGNILVTTEDGSFGEKGYPTQHSILEKEKFDYVFTCGPEPMMKAVAAYSTQKNIPCEVSLENTMACGFGACLCCVTETTEGNKCTCTEGPVFNINDLKW